MAWTGGCARQNRLRRLQTRPLAGKDEASESDGRGPGRGRIPRRRGSTRLVSGAVKQTNDAKIKPPPRTRSEAEYAKGEDHAGGIFPPQSSRVSIKKKQKQTANTNNLCRNSIASGYDLQSLDFPWQLPTAGLCVFFFFSFFFH